MKSKNTLKYCVWFPECPRSARFFGDRKQASHFLNKQKREAYLNEKVGTIHEDTIAGINTT